jgi:hypothetical protein
MLSVCCTTTTSPLTSLTDTCHDFIEHDAATSLFFSTTPWRARPVRPVAAEQGTLDDHGAETGCVLLEGVGAENHQVGALALGNVELAVVRGAYAVLRSIICSLTKGASPGPARVMAHASASHGSSCATGQSEPSLIGMPASTMARKAYARGSRPGQNLWHSSRSSTRWRGWMDAMSPSLWKRGRSSRWTSCACSIVLPRRGGYLPPSAPRACRARGGARRRRSRGLRAGARSSSRAGSASISSPWNARMPLLSGLPG